MLQLYKQYEAKNLHFQRTKKQNTHFPHILAIIRNEILLQMVYFLIFGHI